MIYTSYFANLKKLPPLMVPISICGKAPSWYGGLEYKVLAPKYDFFMQWKENGDNDYYIEQFNSRVLGSLCAKRIEFELYNLAAQVNPLCKDICLICYEKPSDFCHRHLVAEWLNKNGIDCWEWKDSD